MFRYWRWLGAVMVLLAGVVLASDFSAFVGADSMMSGPLALLMLLIFFTAYLLVFFEQQTGISKSKPMIFSAGLLWMLAAVIAYQHDVPHAEIRLAVTNNLDEFAELFLFLMVALIYIKQIEGRGLFELLKSGLVSRGYGYKGLFWLTGSIAFFMSALADNLTTALVIGSVVIAVGKDSPKFTSLGCINTVVACNAGGAFSPFGDITTLMVWQAGKIEFVGFLQIFLPSLVSFLLPAVILTLFLPCGAPAISREKVVLKRHGRMYCGLFLVTIVLAVVFEQLLGLPPYLGMMTGLSILMLAIFLRSRRLPLSDPDREHNLFSELPEAEWDTLMFFFGVMYCLGALSFIGYLAWVSDALYLGYGAGTANVVAGLISAVIDNIPVMFAILQMNPEMNDFQWLLITLCAGIGGSVMSIGSAAGVALMGIGKGHYSFLGHLRWSWAILLGYAAAVATHYLVNG
ncbi:sodium:proton antiporter NhaD [Corallincola spongiicola]|uniref:Sodium:proton antiporter n=1 Tax=Corallincola spongiicola TaxID=2520508 RepID=A0ABY1WP79_9GAMM|nr:sodium:proton antiporter NhaD [Corallincola spongiicola]TAA45762.1 sodium:proton antiporter [Corallincola spongiicola]